MVSMCGIAGCAGTTSQVSRAWLPAARDTLIHRGPDDSGEWWSDDGRVGLAHRRLSVLDLSPLGHQPMHHNERGLSVVYNGEIYNFIELREELKRKGHRFRSDCDTEVLLAAYAEWGDTCLSRLNGMFAFALYDAMQQRLVLARDRAGEKPLYYHIRNKTLYFGSELKSLLANPAMPRRIDKDALDCYLAIGYVPGTRCILEEYQKVPPGHGLSFDLRTAEVQVWPYWRLPDFEGEAEPDSESLLDELEELMEAAVRRQLRADVPIGVLLSGGVDSSLVTAMAVRHSSQVHTFSVGFPGHKSLDETTHARKIARHFNTNHTELHAEPASADVIPLLARQFDEPLADSSLIPTYLVTRLVREQCTVALGGDGGDELFGGYTRYNQLLWIQRRVALMPALGRGALTRAAENLLPAGLRGRNHLRTLGGDFNQDVPQIAMIFSARDRRQLLRGHGPWATPADEIMRGYVPRGQPDLLQRATRAEFASYMPDDILVKVDRASMLNSLEVRAPLLDQHLVEFAFGRVPSTLKTSPTDRKILLKRLTERLLPKDFDRNRKQGFTIPIAHWLKAGPFRDLFHDVLGRTDGVFEPTAVQKLLRSQDRGLKLGTHLFALVQFELWREIYGAHM